MPSRIKQEGAVATDHILTEDGKHLMQEGGLASFRGRRSKFWAQYQFFYGKDRDKKRRKK